MFNVASGGAIMTTTILRLPEVKSRTGLSRSTIYLLISKNSFPSQVSLSDRAVGWIEAEVDQWVSDRIKNNRHSKKTQKLPS